MKKYCVIYHEYSEYNQFEGSWDIQIKSFTTLEAARAEAERLKSNENWYANVYVMENLDFVGV